jgi:transposase
VSRRSGKTISGCASCESLRTRNAALRRQVRVLRLKLQREQAFRVAAEQRVKDLEERLVVNATNSSMPPSASPRWAPRPATKKPTGRKRGAQIGHKGNGRKLLDERQVDDRIEYRPRVCSHCQAGLQEQPGELVGRHQVAELPPRAVRVTEHQSFACRCGVCGAINRAVIPDQVRASSIGPRLSGAIGVLSAFVHGSRRAVTGVVAEVLGCPIALGSISARERELSDALELPYAQLAEQVSQAKVKYVDETGWYQKGVERWLFAAITARAAVFSIEKTRTRRSLKTLLRDRLRGVFCTDRAGIYDLLALSRRGLCWAHLKRDFVRRLERGGAGGAIGEAGLEVCKQVFGLWRDFRQKKITRRELQERAEPWRQKMRQTLEHGAALGIAKTSGLCRGLLKREEAMWNWTKVPGLEPTNNLAERMLRPAVIWRKKSFGSDSRGGSVFVERMLSVIQTAKLRKQNLLDYLTQALSAHRAGLPVPTLGP